MSFVDIIVLIPILFGAYKGFKKGLLMEFVSLIAFFLATVLSFKLLEQGIQLLEPYIGKNQNMLPLLSFILIFVLVMFLVTFIGKALKKFLDITLIGKLDDLAGGLLGAMKWAFAFSVLLWLMESAGVMLPEEHTADSVIYPYLVAYGPVIIDWVSVIMPYAKDVVTSIKALIYIQPN